MSLDSCDTHIFLGLNDDSEFVKDLLKCFSELKNDYIDLNVNVTKIQQLEEYSAILKNKDVHLKSHDVCVFEGTHDCNDLSRWYTKLSLYTIPEEATRQEFIRNYSQNNIKCVKQFYNV